MLRNVTAYFLVFTLLSMNFSRCFIYVGFEANKKFIATSLCENKAKPKMHCNGKCYLAKKVKQAEEKEKSQERQSQKNNLQDALITRKVNLGPSVLSINIPAKAEVKFTLPTQAADIFQPPPFLA